MLAKRIIPCLDVAKGRVVKGVTFTDLADVGDPVQMAESYNKSGADELIFLDITASQENRQTLMPIVKNVAKKVFIPFTVGGGIRTCDDIRKILLCGADKVSINSAALMNPQLIYDAANMYGNQCIVVAIDVKKIANQWIVYLNGGKTATDRDAISWAEEAVQKGAGEILLTSMDADGTRNGFDLEITRLLSTKVSVPVIASGGAGSKKDFVAAFTEGKADAALASSLFHYDELQIAELKNYLQKNNIPVRTDYE